MRTVQITRSGDGSVTAQLSEMRAWLTEAGIGPVDLEALSILRARAQFRATFGNDADAERFVTRFDETAATCDD